MQFIFHEAKSLKSGVYMRRFFVVFMLLIALVPVTLTAQNRVTSVTVSSGQDAIASGITGIIRFGSADSSLYSEIAVQHEQAWLAWGKAIHGRVNGFVAMSVGHFQGAPWIGPYISLSAPVAKIAGKDFSVGSFIWPAFFGTMPDGKKSAGVQMKGIRGGYLGSVNASWGPVTISESLLHFLDQSWNSLPGVAITLPITGDVSTTLSYSQNVNNRNPMYYIGVNWTVPK